MKSHYILLVVLIQGVCGQQPEKFSVEPRAENVVREGEELTLACILHEEATCTWKLEDTGLETSGFMTSMTQALADNGLSALDPKSGTDCSIKINSVTDRHNGKYICSPFFSDGQTDSIAAEVIVAQKPAVVEITAPQAGATELAALSDELTSVTCEARDARPKAKLLWFLGDQELYEGVTTVDETDPGSQLVTSRSTLTRQFGRDDDGAVLRCRAEHQGYVEGDQREATLTVMVQYAPYRAEGPDMGTLYGYTEGEEKVLTVNFTANPPPSEIVWTVGSDRQLREREQTEDGRLVAGDLEEVNAAEHLYSVRLTFRPVQAEDHETAFQLRLTNERGQENITFRLGTGAPPPPATTAQPVVEGNDEAPATDGGEGRPEDADNGGLSGGAIGGIIVALIVLLAVIAIIAFGRSRGKWCFAAESGGETRKEWRAHMDPEAADKEGHDNPGHDQKPDPEPNEHHNGTNGTNGTNTTNANTKPPTDTPV